MVPGYTVVKYCCVQDYYYRGSQLGTVGINFVNQDPRFSVFTVYK
jgi:hypothetical protein